MLKCNLLLSALQEDSQSAAPSAAHRDALTEASTSVPWLGLLLVSESKTMIAAER